MKRKKLLRFTYNWVVQICDPLWMIRGLKGLFWYIADYCAYIKMPGAKPVRLLDMYPCLHDRQGRHELDVHYFYVNAWAIRRIIANRPLCHIDVASQVILAALLSAVIPVTYLDFRILETNLEGLQCLSGNILDLPYGNDTIESVSCLHVAEHIGLGRYGDPLCPDGTKKAAGELKRVLAKGGNLYFALPIGKPRLCFNAHRIHSAETICEYFSGLELVEYSGVGDDGKFRERVNLSEFRDSDYACGMFWFKKHC